MAGSQNILNSTSHRSHIINEGLVNIQGGPRMLNRQCLALQSFPKFMSINSEHFVNNDFFYVQKKRTKEKQPLYEKESF